jgi:hypothetical protein
VPEGASVWEAGANSDPKRKAQSDYDTRAATPGGVNPADTVFVFATSRRWAEGQNWAVERRGDGIWKDVVVRDAEAIHGWLEETPDVHVWLSEQLGGRPMRVRTLATVVGQISARTRPPLPPALLLAGRDEQAKDLASSLAGDAAAVAIRGGSRDEALAFIGAAIAGARDDTRGEPLVVRDAEAFERLVLTERPLSLVVRNPEGTELGEAVARGHHVILALGAGDFAGEDAIELPRLDRSAAREALTSAGVPFENADRLAGVARRSFAALVREMAVAPGGARPRWASGDDAPLLAALLLVGGWSGIDGDREVVAGVTGRAFDDVQAVLLRHVSSDDPAWTRSAGSWRLVSPDDSWAMLHPLLTDQVLGRWHDHAVAVLSDIDPRLGLDQAERLMADIRDERRPAHSGALRSGLAQAAALLGARGDRPQPSGLVAATFATSLVRHILDAAHADHTGGLWSSLTMYLPHLAEAAPDVFLDAVADGLASEPSPILAMFADGPGTPALLGSSSPHTGLLWALEGVAWSPQHLVRAVLLLGELADREPGGRLGNRPDRSLRTILLPRIPQTSASPEQRIAALDALRERWPSVAWPLELTLLPRLHDSSSPSHQPRFRDWRVDQPRVAANVLFTQTIELAARVGEDAAEDPRRWAELIPQIDNLPQPARNALLNILGAMEPDGMDEQDRLALWRALVDEADRHRSMPDAQWSLGADYAKRLMGLADAFQDPDPPERHARLFDYRVRMPDVPRGDYQAQREAVQQAREAAAAEIYGQGGIAYLVRLAHASRIPRAVGAAHGAANDDADADVLMSALGIEGPQGEMAAGWVAQRLADGGDPWRNARCNKLPALSTEAQATFLLELSATKSTWELADRLSVDVQERYWRSADPYRFSREDLEEGVERMLAHGRPWAAVDALAAAVGDDGHVDVDLADRVLSDAAGSEPAVTVDVSYEIGQVLDAMERSGADPHRLAVHEFALFAALDQERSPRALVSVIADDPAVFADVARHAVDRDDGAEDPVVRPELSWHASRVLNGLRGLPGQTGDGLDADALRAWVDRARAALTDLGRSNSGDELLGRMLARAPVDVDDGIWPARAVRDVIEAAGSRRLASGLVDGHVEARGPTFRGIHDGGGQERRLAHDLRRDADALDVRWPVTARILRDLASTYEQFAQHEDRRAQHDADAD